LYWKEVLKKIGSMGMENKLGLMGRFIKENGTKENSMEKES